jgi:3-oxoacyl-[acyl-carrier-protein] synthase III
MNPRTTSLAETTAHLLERLRAVQRTLGLPENRIWSETARTGNLGSASVPIAWSLHESLPAGLAAWTVAGAGLMWGAALLGEVP